VKPDFGSPRTGSPTPKQTPRPLGQQIAKRPHVCFVAMNIFPVLSGATDVELAGGAEVQQAILAKMLHGDGFQVSVLTADHGQPEVVDCQGVKVYRVRSPGNRGLRGLRFLYPHMSDVVAGLRRIDADIIYFRVAGFRAAAAAWYARRYGKRFVYACASDLELLPDANWLPSLRESLPFRWALRSADAVLLQNARQEQLLAARHRGDGVIVPNCYAEPEAKPGVPDGHVLWVGTVKPIKSPERFVELAREHPAKRFVLVGGPNTQSRGGQDYFRQVQLMAEAVPNLLLTGYVQYAEVGQYFDGASVFVNTSDVEGFPNTFLQAWIRGIPSLSFVRPELRPGETGTILCKDMPDLVSHVAALTSDAGVWQEASRACSAHFTDNHSVDIVLQHYRTLFERLTDRRAHSLG
jgi:glycosyltransferase involved in cell wall biosynthesis